MNKIGRTTITVIAMVMFFAMGIVLSGCDTSVTVRGKAFYPKENNGQEWKSRQANPEKPIWSWGDAHK